MYSITFINRNWPQIQFEVRAGASADCDLNGQMIPPTILALNESRNIDTDKNEICWRMTNDPPDLTSGWTGWLTLSPDDIGNPYTEYLDGNV